MRQGPLSGLKVIEFAGLGPAPFCGMLLSDLGADVIRIDRKGGRAAGKFDPTARGRRSIAFDLKKPEAIAACLDLIAGADALIEGFRPGVMERLGLGPDVALKTNPKLVYGRVTGWGQTGPLAQVAGHDLNFVAVTGALHAIGTADQPVPPLNLVGDQAGGAMYLAFGLLAAIVHARETGRGQVVDAAITDGVASLMAMWYGSRAEGSWRDERVSNLADGGPHFARTYRCADGRFISISSFEPPFYALLLEKTGLDDPDLSKRMDPATWPAMREKLAAIFAGRTQAEWCAMLEGTDVCFAPVLTFDEAFAYPHNVERGTFVELDGVIQPAPAPRFSETPGSIQRPPPEVGQHDREALSDWGFSEDAIAGLRAAAAMA